MKYTLTSAREAHEKGTLRDWCVGFLHGDGANKKLADRLKEEKDTWVDLVEFPLEKLRREMGPEDEALIFSESQDIWDKRVRAFVDDIKEGYEPCPLIATDFWNDLHLADGSHRHDALMQAGFDTYWTIFFTKDQKNKEWILSNRPQIL